MTRTAARSRLALAELESRAVPSRTLPFPVIYVGAETGSPPVVKAFDAETGAVNFTRTVYEPGFAGGVRVATADFTGDLFPDLVVAPGTGGGPRVRVLDGKTGDPVAGPLGDFWAYEPSFHGGVEVAAADVDADGVPDVLTAAGKGGGPRVRAFSGATGEVLADFMVFGKDFRGGVSLAAADFTRDGRAELAVGAGPGGGPHVRVFDVATAKTIPGPLGNFFAYEPTFKGGVHVGTDWKAGDVNFDGVPELAVGPGKGHAPTVHLYSGAGGELLRAIPAFESSMTAGVREGLAQVSDDPRGDVVVSTGRGVPGEVRVFDGPTGRRLTGSANTLQPFGAGFTGRVTLAAGNDPPMCCGQPTPFDQTFTFTDGFDSGDGLSYNEATVRQVITSDSDGQPEGYGTGTMTWSFTITNTSSDDPERNDDLYDTGLGYFDLQIQDLADITPVPNDESPGHYFYKQPSTDADGNLLPYGQLAWTGGPLAVGQSVHLSFQTPDRPAMCGSGAVFHEWNGGDSGFPETSAAGGTLMVPGKDGVVPEPDATALEDITKDLTIRYYLNDVDVGNARYTGAKQIIITDVNGEVLEKLSFAVQVEATITKCLWDRKKLLTLHGEDAYDNEQPPGGTSVPNEHEKGHLLSKQFGGRGDLRNIVGLRKAVNRTKWPIQVDGVIKAKLNALSNPTDKVTVKFVPYYNKAATDLFGKRILQHSKPSSEKLWPESILVLIDNDPPVTVRNPWIGPVD